MTPFASPTGEPRPDMVLLLGVLGIALSLSRTRIRAAAGRARALALALAQTAAWRRR